MGFLGLDSLFSGDVQAFDEAIRLGQQTGDLTMTLLALCHSADLTTFRGQLYAAQALYEQALELATQQDGRRQPVAGLALIGLGRLLREWNDLDRAARYLAEGIELAQKWSGTSVVQGYVALAHVQQARGDAMAAREAIKIAQRLAANSDAMQPNPTDIAMQEVRLALVRDDVEAASRSIAACDLQRLHLDDLEREADGGSFSLLQTLDTFIALAWVRVAQGQPDEAMTILASLLRATEAAGWTGIVIEILALQSLAYQSLGNTPQALAMLERALSLAKPEGYVRLFVEKGKPMQLLLQRMNAPCEGGRMKEYVDKLLKAFSTDKIALAPESEMIEPLSERERQVLRLLAEGLSDKAIAETLVIASGTVNKHLKNIYGKLDAHSRTQAVARGRELGLL
jgi:LuxR family maltose regulon positive regulatory protein